MSRVNMTLSSPDEWWMDYDVEKEEPEQHEFMLWLELYNESTGKYEKVDENGDEFTVLRHGATAEDAAAAISQDDIDDIVNEFVFINGYDEDWFKKTYTDFDVYYCLQTDQYEKKRLYSSLSFFASVFEKYD